MYANDYGYYTIGQADEPGVEFKQNLWHQKLRHYLGWTGDVKSWEDYTGGIRRTKVMRCPAAARHGDLILPHTQARQESRKRQPASAIRTGNTCPPC